MVQHVQHALIQHRVHTTRLYNTLIQHANRKIRQLKNGKETVKERQRNTHKTRRKERQDRKLHTTQK